VEKISIQKLKWIKSLQLKKNRDKEGYFIIEGEKMGKECMFTISDDICMIGCLSSYQELIPKNLQDKSFILSTKEFERVSRLKTPNKLIVVIKKPSIILFNPNERFLILENIQDPGNFGTIIRTADWFGIHQIVCSPESADVFNSKTLQASMGSFLRVQIYYKELIPFLDQSNYNVAGALLDGEPIEKNNLKNSNAIMLGNEGQGISNPLEKFCKNPVKITGYGGAESLNISIAASILMYEWTKKSKS
jgi:RNA methyltransferase, TrmH family